MNRKDFIKASLFSLLGLPLLAVEKKVFRREIKESDIPEMYVAKGKYTEDILFDTFDMYFQEPLKSKPLRANFIRMSEEWPKVIKGVLKD